MGKLRAKSDYESLRNARILENQARLASLGVQKTIFDLRSIVSSAKPKKEVRKWQKKEYNIAPVRRSIRFKGVPPPSTPTSNSLRRSNRLRGKVIDYEERKEGSKSFSSDGREKRPANAPSVTINDASYQLSAQDSARRCRGKEGRCSVYNPVFGICCHFCRQKTLCAEEDCKRCGNLDANQPCIAMVFCVGLVSRLDTVKGTLAKLLRDKDEKPLWPEQDLIKETNQPKPQNRGYIHTSKWWNHLSGCDKEMVRWEHKQ
ncbi:hypothetical protein V6N12_019138 [Hibiscus sabdariffa]|uniref:Zinc-finger domain-containing protein n=1 Tax=Hibiscus sabdariffa TaxID=183260 RepID=A0ABR2BA51_9ROSI